MGLGICEELNRLSRMLFRFRLDNSLPKITRSPYVVSVNKMDKIGSIGARLIVDDILLKRN